MLNLLSSLTAEVVASGIVGLIMLGVVARNVVSGWQEARKKMRESETSMNPLTTALSVSWDRDQIERALQALEDIAENLAQGAKASQEIAHAQGIMSDQFQQSTQSKLQDILKKLDQAEKAPRTRARR